MATAPQNGSKDWMGPVVRLSLPSFSGRTEYISDLLKYSCQIECRIALRAVSPAKVLGPSYVDGSENISFETQCRDTNDIKRDLSISVMLSKPILALEFNCLKMKVDAPTIVPR
ncbi:Protein NEOXANTHIN-DEFICIENT 1 [Orobanche gracilis]